MSQGPHQSGGPPEEEGLSGTLFGGLQNLASVLGGLSTAFASMGIVSLVIGLVIFGLVPDLRFYGYIILGTGAILLGLGMVISFRTVSRAITGRRGRYSTNTTIMVIAFIGIAAVVNFLAFESKSRMDVTATKQFSLAPRTVDLVKNLKEPVEAKAFFKKGPTFDSEIQAYHDQVASMLHEFDVRSSNFSYEFIDPDIDSLTAKDYGGPQTGTVVFESRDPETNAPRRQPVSPSPFVEQEFVTGLLIVTGQEQKHVYFLAGHDERATADLEESSEGFGLAQDAIRSENYRVRPLNLLIKCSTLRDPWCIERETGQERLEKDRQENKVNMLVVAGPRKDLLEGEAEILHEYLKNGGQMLLLLDPDTPQSFRDFLSRWGVVLREGHIVDEERSLGDNNEITVLAGDQYISTLPVPGALDRLLGTRKVTAGLGPTYYPGIAAIEPAEEGVFIYPSRSEVGEDDEGRESATIIGTALGLTSRESWLIKEATRNERREGDPQGPFFHAVAIKALGPLDEERPSDSANVSPASLIVFGDSDFASNNRFYTSGNSDIFLNSVNWLVGDIALADIRPKPPAFRALVLTRSEFNFMRYSGWLFLPALMALLGGFVWWRRR